jgi:hypothetical protein
MGSLTSKPRGDYTEKSTHLYQNSGTGEETIYRRMPEGHLPSSLNYLNILSFNIFGENFLLKRSV